MNITINFIDKLSTSTGKKRIMVKVEGSISIKTLYKLAQIQEGNPTLYRELEGLMIIHNSKLLNYREALNKELSPGEEILLLPLKAGG